MKFANSISMLISVLCCLVLAGIVSGADDGANLTDDAQAAELVSEEHYTTIFVQEGDGGSFVKDESGNYTLTITGMIPYTVYFTDRPARNAGIVEMETFLEGFSFDPNDPPNALVAIREGEEERDMIVVELTDPQYDNTTDTLTYRAKVIADYEFESEWPKDLLPRADDEIPEEFGKVVIVVDDCPCLPYGACHSYIRNSCWHTHEFSCRPCGGCCGD
jgi:hypothetical protein